MNESILEFGSGNGHLLVSLAKKGFKNLRGLDYSEDAILLASEYAASTEFGNIGFFQADILAGFGPTISKVGVVLDKGTFDAMSLGPELDDDVMRRNEATQPRVVSICKKYKDALETITNPGASFIITSCNWTGDELIQLFGPEWESADEIKHPSFSFGGKLGNTVTSIVFNKRF